MKRFIPIRKKTTPLPGIDPTLEHIVRKCGGKLEAVVEYILASAQEDRVCRFCRRDECGDLIACASATAASLKERDGNA